MIINYSKAVKYLLKRELLRIAKEPTSANASSLIILCNKLHQNGYLTRLELLSVTANIQNIVPVAA